MQILNLKVIAMTEKLMSEKRFWFVIDKGKLDYVQDNILKEKITVSELEDLLNEKEVRIKTLENENKRLAKNLKVQKDNVDANFRSAQYWRQKFEAIPENIRMVWTE